MKITILDGNTDPNAVEYENYLAKACTALNAAGHTVNHIQLRNFDLRYCTGCFGCWVKTPGECVTVDDGPKIRPAELHCDFLLWAAPLVNGYPSAKLKQMMDKSIPLIHPYIAVVHGEAHHRKRYDRYPLAGLLVGPEADTDAEDLRIVEDMFRRTALNMKSRLCFMHQVGDPLDELVKDISNAPSIPERIPPAPAATIGERIDPPTLMAFVNGSPRGHKRSNTVKVFDHFLGGFRSVRPESVIDTFDLVHLNQQDEILAGLQAIDAVWIGFPLYADAMPGLVKEFFEKMRAIKTWSRKPALGFFVQSGFPEAIHSRFIEAYLRKLAARLGCVYLGTIVKGGCEGIIDQPEKMTAGLFGQFRAIGEDFARSGSLNGQLLKKLASPEKYNPILAPIFELLRLTGMMDFWWNMQLKQNGVYDQRFARPYDLE